MTGGNNSNGNSEKIWEIFNCKNKWTEISYREIHIWNHRKFIIALGFVSFDCSRLLIMLMVCFVNLIRTTNQTTFHCMSFCWMLFNIIHGTPCCMHWVVPSQITPIPRSSISILFWMNWSDPWKKDIQSHRKSFYFATTLSWKLDAITNTFRALLMSKHFIQCDIRKLKITNKDEKALQVS